MSERPPVQVIILRAAPGHAQTLRRVAELGFAPISAPMLELSACKIDPPKLGNYTGLVFTSANGVRFLTQCLDDAPLMFDRPAYCVGPATLEAARTAGFTNCLSADGDAQDLARLILSNRGGEEGPLLHVANSAAAGTLVRDVCEAGRKIDFLPLYAAMPARTHAPEVVSALAGKRPAICLAHSAKAAEAFAALYQIPPATPHLLVAVSHKAAAPLASAGFARLYLAARPNEAALMGALKTAAASL